MLPFSSYRGHAPQGQETLCELIAFDQNKVNLFAAQVAACPPHWHESPELIVVLSGAYAINVDDRSRTIVAPGLIFINQDQVHALKALTEHSTLLTVQFGRGLFDDSHKAPVLVLNTSLPVYQAAVPAPERRATSEWTAVVQAVHALVSAQLQDPSSFEVLACIYHLLSSITKLARTLATQEPPAPEQGNDQSPRYADMRRAIDYLNRHYDQDVKLEEVAALAHMSYFHFSRMFKQICQHSFKEYLMLIRLNHAKTLLRDTSIHITDIATRCGFHDHKQFISACKKVLGMTPTEFRKVSALALRALHEQTGSSEAPNGGVTVVALQQAQAALEQAFALSPLCQLK